MRQSGWWVSWLSPLTPYLPKEAIPWRDSTWRGWIALIQKRWGSTFINVLKPMKGSMPTGATMRSSQFSVLWRPITQANSIKYRQEFSAHRHTRGFHLVNPICSTTLYPLLYWFLVGCLVQFEKPSSLSQGLWAKLPSWWLLLHLYPLWQCLLDLLQLLHKIQWCLLFPDRF